MEARQTYTGKITLGHGLLFPLAGLMDDHHKAQQFVGCEAHSKAD